MNIGSLFSGYGGLDMAVRSVLGGRVSWVSDIDNASCTVLAAHHPDVPNLGDITAVDWATVSPVDILTGGYPCQPFSHAGQRKGKNDERHLWPYVCAAIDALRPGLVVLENVRGHLTLGFGDVLADLSRVGYDARWGIVRASDAGAPHGRARLFILAHPTGKGLQGLGISASTVHRARHERAGSDSGAELPSDPTRGIGGTRPGRGVPEPEGPARPTTHDLRTPPHPDRYGHGCELHAGGMASVEGQSEKGPRQRERARGVTDTSRSVDWGKYSLAIARWERVTGRRAPAPTVSGSNGRPRLSPVFTEWLMGLPEGHVTGHGLSNAQALRLCGNGVVPQQANLALRMLGVGA